MRSTTILLAVLCLAVIVPSTLAFWRLPCTKPIAMLRVDPIVNNGTLAGHVHTIMGASGFHGSSTNEDVRKSKCSTCIVKEDNSNYWIASLFFQHANGTIEAVPQDGGMLVYYLQRPGYDGERIKAFPSNLRMLAGNPHLRNSTNSLENQAISYACINYYQGSKETSAFPQKNCPQGLRVQVFFPSCWDGVNTDSADHKSHMAYPSGMNTGICPKTHPVKTIAIFYEVFYNGNKFKDLWLDTNGKPYRAMPFFWSTGDNTGFGHHGDFLNGWDTDVLQRASDECTDMSGNVKYCKHFTFRSDDEANGCRPEYVSQVNETVLGQMETIPNVNKLPVSSFDPCGHSPFWQFDDTVGTQPLGSCKGTFTGKPAYAFSSAPVVSTTAIKLPAPVLAPNPIKQLGYLGCFSDAANGAPRTLEKKLGDGYTVESCRNAVAALSSKYVVFGIQYGGECWASESSTSYSSQGSSSRCLMACNAETYYICGGPNANQVYSVRV